MSELRAVNREAGIWSKTYEIGEYFGMENSDLFITFRCPNNTEYVKMQAADTKLFATNGVSQVRIPVTDKAGKVEERFIDPDAMIQQESFISDLMQRCIIDHNFSFAQDKQGKLIQAKNSEVWAEVCKRPALIAHLVTDWRESLPLGKNTEAK